jgi:catechol 2,3-dioxygenase-like lactoylglutathione lyase family enzyme
MTLAENATAHRARAAAKRGKRTLIRLLIGGEVCAAVCVSLLACRVTAGQAIDPADSNPMQLQADHVTASVANLDKEEEWYVRVFGFREVVRHKRGPDFEVRHLSLGVYHIDLAWQRGSVRQKETGYLRQGWEHVVFTTPTLEAAYERLVKLSTDVRADRNAQGRVWRLFLHDPEGNELEIVASDGETRATLPQLPAPVPESVLPAGENRDLVIRTCTVCHPADLVAKRHTQSEWASTLSRMADRGAVATPDEQVRILDYLNKNFGL